MNTPEHTTGYGKLLTGLTLLLCLAVGAQSILLYRLYRQVNRPIPSSAPGASSAATEPAASGLSLPFAPPTATPTPPVPFSGPTPFGAAPSSPPPPFAGGIPRFGFPNDWDDLFNDAIGSDDLAVPDVLREMQATQERMNRALGATMNRLRNDPALGPSLGPSLFAPHTDLKEEPDRYIVRMDIPGADKSDIQIEMDDRTLRVSGARERTTAPQGGGALLRMERQSGRFMRAITLPGPVEVQQVNAQYEQGVLTITLPKAKTEPVKKHVPIV